MQAARLLTGSTRSAAEQTTGPSADAASADTDENDRVCVGGLGPCPCPRCYGLLLKATSERSADTDENDRVCVVGLGPCPRCYGLLLKATSERTSGMRLLVCTSCAHLLRAPTYSEELVTCMGF